MSFQKGDIVWVKIEEFPLWPCKVIKKVKAEEALFYEVKFLGENSSAHILHTDVFPFDTHRVEFTPDQATLKKHKHLAKALREAVDVLNKRQSNHQRVSMSRNGSEEKKVRKPRKLKATKGISAEAAAKTKDNPIVVPDEEEPCKEPQIDPKPTLKEPPAIKKESQSIKTLSKKREGRKEISPTPSQVSPRAKLPKRVTKGSLPEVKPGLTQILKNAPIPKQQAQSSNRPSIREKEKPIDSKSQEILNYKEQLKEKRRVKEERKEDMVHRIQQKQENPDDQENQEIHGNRTFSLETLSSSTEWTMVNELHSKLHCLNLALHHPTPSQQTVEKCLQDLQVVFKNHNIKVKHFMTSRIVSLASFIVSRLPPIFEEYREWMARHMVEDVNKLIFDHFNNISLYERVFDRKPAFPKCEDQSQIKYEEEEGQGEGEDESQESEVRPFEQSDIASSLNNHFANHIVEKVSSVISSKVVKLEESDIDVLTDKIKEFLMSQSDPNVKWETLKKRLEDRSYSDKAECLEYMDEYMKSI